jgi:hypothetical protein
MAKKKSSYTIPKVQQDEFRRLTQFANRRIKAAMEEYEKHGKEIAPYDVTGGVQTRRDWFSSNYALSRSVNQFANEKEYRQHLHWLRQFEHMRPNITEYTNVQREKTLGGIETSLGVEPNNALRDIINNLSAPQLSEFWDKFSEISAKMGMKYSSNDALQATVNEFVAEHVDELSNKVVNGLANNIQSRQLEKNKALKAPQKKQPKTKRGRKKAAKKRK